MKFYSGMTAPAGAGRPRGSKNRRKTFDVLKALTRAGIDPVKKLVELEAQLTSEEKRKLWSDLLSYCAARPRAIETSAPSCLPAPASESVSSHSDESCSTAELLAAVKSSQIRNA